MGVHFSKAGFKSVIWTLVDSDEFQGGILGEFVDEFHSSHSLLFLEASHGRVFTRLLPKRSS
jgi:hypothetical protein